MRLFEFPMEEKMKIRLNGIRSLFSPGSKIVDVLFYQVTILFLYLGNIIGPTLLICPL